MSGVPQAQYEGDREKPAERAEDAQVRELKGRIHYLEHALWILETRLRNLEASFIFRFLRWLGSRLAPSPPSGQDDQERYAMWAQERALSRSIASRQEPGAAARSSQGSSVVVLIDARAAEPEKLARTLESLTCQEHGNWELLLAGGPAPPSWLDDCVSKHIARHSSEIISSADQSPALDQALSRPGADFILFIHPHAVLDPDALAGWLAAADSDAAALYSDWDHLDNQGRHHAPRFTPELSRTLLAQTPYWGDCYLVRMAALRAAGWPKENTHDLARRLAESGQPVRRVPRMLWHLQDVPAMVTSSAEAPPAAFSAPASIIICSRDPKRIDKCLRALAPTLDPRHEVIVVAHRQFGEVSGMEQIAARHGARCVPYQGPFHFGEMNRIGVEASRNPVLCLLNDDTLPLAKDWLDRMVAQANQTDAGIVGALLLYPSRTIQHAGIVVGNWRPPAHIGRGLSASPLWPWLRLPREVSAVTAACMVLRRSVWDELRGFEFQFPVNFNDVDLCLRAGARGYRVLIETRAVLIHEEARTRVAEVLPEERALFYERWSSVLSAPDKFFNPQLEHESDRIQLPSPWTNLR